MGPITMEQGLEVTRISKDAFRAVQRPFTWPFAPVIPGGLLMALSASAAYETVEPGFSIDSLSTHFLLGPTPDFPIDLEVQRLSDGGRIATRVVALKQQGKTMVHVTCSFIRVSAMGGPSMRHSASRETAHKADAITLDDLEQNRTDWGPYMKYQRFPLTKAGPLSTQASKPQDLIHPCVATVSPAISSDSLKLHLLGIILLSDYHVLDCPPTVHDLTVGHFRTGDTTRTPTPHDFERITSLNHNIVFHVHEGFRADDLCYIEARSPWTNSRRGEIQSRIFGKDGVLLATCKQEGYYVLKNEKNGGKL